MLASVVVALLAAQITPAPPMADIDDVVVTGARQVFRLDGRAFRAAKAEFDAQRGRYAPSATLRFIARGAAGATAIPLRIAVTDGTRKMYINLDADGAFDLPELPARKWWLEVNRPESAVRIEPLTLSSSSTRQDYRLGDARLQCRVFWSMEKAMAPLLAAPAVAIFKIAGPCTSKRIGIYVTAPSGTKAGSVQEGVKTLPVWLSPSKRSYRLPIDDKSLSNEARVKIVTG